MKKTAVFIFPDFAKGEKDPNVVLERLNFYGSAYAEKSKGKKLIAIIRISQDRFESLKLKEFEHVLVLRVKESSNGFVKFALESRSILKSFRISPGILISGDVYLGFLTCMVLRILLLPKQIPIQISIHGYYIENILSSRRKLRKLIKFYHLLTYKLANSIRVVSPELRANLIDRYQVSEKKIFISPIPILLKPLDAENNRSIDFLFVGRFHEERGIDLLIELTKQIAVLTPPLNFVFVGSGPLEIQFESELRKLPIKYEFRGQIPNSKLIPVYNSSKIFVSTATSEGYGLSIREALSYGCILLALRNEVTASLASEYPDLVYLYRTANQATALMSSLIHMELNRTSIENFRIDLQSKNQDSIQALVSSWC